MLFRKEYGKRENPTLIFLHGFLGSHLDFKPLIETLQEDFFCVALDLPGHRNSKEIAFTDYSTFEKALLESLLPYQSSPLSLVGYSMGGRISVQLASKMQVHSLILISSAVEPLSAQEKKLRVVWEKKQVKSLTKDSFSNFLENWYSLPIFKSLKENQALYYDMLKKRVKENPQALVKVMQITSPITLETPPSFLSYYSKPLLYFCGQKDLKYQEQALRVKARFKNASIYSIENVSHAAHLEAPQSISNQIKNFYRTSHDRMDTKTNI